jgi:hypothetical protein
MASLRVGDAKRYHFVRHAVHLFVMTVWVEILAMSASGCVVKNVLFIFGQKSLNYGMKILKLIVMTAQRRHIGGNIFNYA